MIVSYLYIGALLVFSSTINSSNGDNPCAGLPLCKLKKDVTGSSEASSSSSSSAPRIRSFLRRPRPSLFKRPTTTESPEISLDQTTESEKQNMMMKKSDENDGCFGLPLCVLSKGSRGPSVRTTTVSTRTKTAPSFVFEAGSSSSGSLIKEVLNGHADEALQLIEDGADVTTEDTYGNSVLHIAAQNGRLDVIRAILLGGANVNAENNHKNTPLQLAAQNGWTDIAKLLLTAKKIDINKFDLHKNTALHLAAQNGQIGVVEALIEAGADINPVNSHKHIPLHLSAQNGHLALSKLLIDNGGDYNYKDLIGNTPLHTAIHTSHNQIANMFISAGADAKIKNLSGQNCL
ncbi:unnamed protein product [Lepeophtheirus salmonis]|uniref:(salmon louse) hypothetical protein n=1 Tax=Lepeophtheirus salmonis TaxID=72036 RepID=A0A7R8D640_LEPSM|nr:unnamed protein product [Lepeophtheirus salmonis]CAF3041437.1 unnamed protein product [Lepeophtheirus salmonis]